MKDAYLVAVQRGDIEEGTPATVFHVYEHDVFNDYTGAWTRVKQKFGEHGATILMGKVTNKAVPATHVDVVV